MEVEEGSDEDSMLKEVNGIKTMALLRIFLVKMWLAQINCLMLRL
jgi:hypothetical protein